MELKHYEVKSKKRPMLTESRKLERVCEPSLEIDERSMNCRSCPHPRPERRLPAPESSRRQRVEALDMADAEVSEKISLHVIEGAEEGSQEKDLTWREKLARLLQTNKVQYTIIVLVILDSLIVIFELLIDMGIIIIPENQAHEVSNNGSAHGSPHDSAHGTSHISSNHQEEHHSSHDSSHSYPSHNITISRSNHSAPYVETSHAAGGGHEHHAPNKHLVEHILHLASLIILSIFVVEVIAKILAEGKHLLKHKAEVFDALVVIVSFTMDITFTFVNVTEATKDYAGLLVLLRLWRVTRIINGVILSVKMDADKKLAAQKALRAKAEEQVQKLTEEVEKLKAVNETLRDRLAKIQEDRDMMESGEATLVNCVLSGDEEDEGDKGVS